MLKTNTVKPYQKWWKATSIDSRNRYCGGSESKEHLRYLAAVAYQSGELLDGAMQETAFTNLT